MVSLRGAMGAVLTVSLSLALKMRMIGKAALTLGGQVASALAIAGNSLDQSIAKVWKDMKGINKDALLELIAGKNRGSAVGGMLNNWETAQKALEVSTKSAGSAYKEQDKWMQSIEAKQKKMTASFQAFSTSAVSSDLVGMGFDAGSTIFSGLQAITDLLGSIPTLAAAAAAAAISIVFKKGISFVKYAPYRRNCAMA